MKKIFSLFSGLLICAVVLAQAKDTTIINKILKEIKDFRTGENKRDSSLGHVFGSYKEEDYLRRYTFYRSVAEELQGVHKSRLSFDDQVNLELLQYETEDEVSSYTFKSYLNPILSDEGFHTGLPGRADCQTQGFW